MIKDREFTFKTWVTAVGLRAAAVRHDQLGHWCGYVAVPQIYKDCGNDYNDLDIDVHGGLTYGRDCLPMAPPDGVNYWYGFDCSHAGDITPYTPIQQPNATYKDINFVTAECEYMAQQFVQRHKEYMGIKSEVRFWRGKKGG